MRVTHPEHRGFSLAITAFILAAASAAPTEAGWPRRRRVAAAQAYAVAPSRAVAGYATSPAYRAVSPQYVFPPAPQVRRSGFGSHFNPAYGLGPGYFATPPGPYFPE